MFLFIPPRAGAGLLCLLAVLGLAVLGLAACSGTKDDATPRSAASVIARVEQRNARIRGFQAQGSVSVETPEQSSSGAIELKLLKPDSLLFEIFGPFGVRVAKGFVTADTFTFYNNLDNTVASGATSAGALRSLLHVSMDFHALLDILSGTLGVGPGRDSAGISGADNGSGYRIVRPAGNGERLEYDVNLSYEAVTRCTRKDGGGRILEEITFRDFRKKQGLHVPTIITITRPNDDESVTLAYDQFYVNELPMDFSFSYPRSAARIRL